MKSEEANNFEDGKEVVLPVEKAESVTSETSYAASTSSTNNKMKIDEITGEENEHAMEIDSISNSTKPNSNNFIVFLYV